MKKTLFKFFGCIILLVFVFLFTVSYSDVMVSAKEEKSLNYLVIGLDDAAQNADVIMLVGAGAGEGNLNFLQIPRDTFYNYGGGQNKINGAFAAYRNSGMTEREALGAFAADIERLLGVDICASFAVTIAAFRSFVDGIGGVVVDMPYKYTFTDERGNGKFTLDKGENLLDGEKAETFIRYRRGYALGDLSRINAQKIFLKGMIKTVIAGRFTRVASAVFSIRENLYANCKTSDIIKILTKKPSRNGEIACRFITLPGEALIDGGGISYFCANRKNSTEVLLRYFSSDGFDEEGELFNSDERAFYNVYYDESASYFEYNDNNLDSIKLR